MADPSRISLSDLTPIVEGASKEFGVPSEHIWNVIRAENSGSPQGAKSLTSASSTATTSANAKGVMQVTPVALKDVIQSGLIPDSVRHEAMSVADQVRVGTAYLSKLQKLSDKPEEIYAMYNYGPKARFRMADLPEETKGYLAKTGASSSTSQEVSTGGGGTGTFGRGTLDSSQLVRGLLGNLDQQNAAMTGARDRATAGFELGVEQQLQSVSQQREAVAQGAAQGAQKANIQFQQDKTIEDLQRLFGLDQSQVDNEIGKSLAVAQNARDQRVGVRAQYDELAGRDLLTNPIGYLLAQMQLPSVAARNNALADAEDLALSNIDKRTQQFTAAKSSLVANTSDQIRDYQYQQAQVESRLAEAKLLGKEGEISAARAGTELQLAGVTNALGDNVRSTVSTVVSLEDREEASKLRNEQREQILGEKKLKAEEDARLNQRLKLASDTLGLEEPMTLSRLKGLTSKKEQDMWLGVALSGQMGQDLEESLAFYLGNGSRNGIQTKGGASTLMTAERLAASGASFEGEAARTLQALNQGKMPKKEEARSKAYELYRDTLVNSTSGVTSPLDLGSSQWDRTYNPYKAEFLSFNKAVDSNEKLAILKNNKVKTMVDDLVKSGAVKDSNLTAAQQQAVLAGIGDLVSEKKLDPQKAAADISTYFKAASAYNRQLNKYDLFSLPKQESYLFTVEGTAFASNRKKVDLFNASDIENSLIWRAKQKHMQTPFGKGTSAEQAFFSIGFGG